MTAWSRRYAHLARELAAKEQNPPRKQELLEIGDVCEWVPENPARTFREPLQAQWWGSPRTSYNPPSPETLARLRAIIDEAFGRRGK
jgi:pyruvate-formate lyase